MDRHRSPGLIIVPLHKSNRYDFHQIAVSPVIFHTKTGELESYGKIQEMEQLTGSGFYRCHRCYLVNLEKIISYNANTIKVSNGDTLILSQKKYNDFVRQYMKYAKNGGIVNV